MTILLLKSLIIAMKGAFIMRVKEEQSTLKPHIASLVLAIVLIVALCFSSISTVMANTVSASVIDGDKTYTFNMDSSDIDVIIKRAESMGLEPINPETDIVERVGATTTVSVRRGVDFSVTEASKVTELKAYKGDTVAKTLEDNQIIIKERDVVTPSLETVITESTDVKIDRFCTVTVTDVRESKTRTVALTGATVRDAINEVGIKLTDKDGINYDIDEPLFDNMSIKVMRKMTVKIKADGKETEHTMLAETVGEALDKAKIKLEKDDRVEPAKEEKLSEAMEIVVKRVKIEEEERVDEVDFETKEETSDDMYSDESKTKTEGVKGEKKVKVKKYIVDGEFEKEEIVDEKVTKEPVSKVVVTGTKKRQTSSGGSGSVGTATPGTDGTFVDHNGNTVAYRSVYNGTGSAYCDSGLTASGAPCGWGNVAVNPNVIPFGTKLYVCSSDGSYVYGYCIAADSGGALFSGRVLVDLWLPTEADCYAFGLKNVNVYVVD